MPVKDPEAYRLDLRRAAQAVVDHYFAEASYDRYYVGRETQVMLNLRDALADLTPHRRAM